MQTRRHRVKIRDLGRAYALILADSIPRTAVVFVHGFLGNPLKTWQSFQTLADANNAAYPWWGDSDLFFYDYPDFDRALDFTGRDFLQFLGRVYPYPDASLFEADLTAWASILHLDQPIVRVRQNFAGYTRLVLAGHSEGGVVIRKAMLELANQYIRANEEITTLGDGSPRPHGWFHLEKRGGGFVKIPYKKIPVPVAIPLDLANYPALHAQLCLFAPALMGASPSGILGVLARKIDILHYSRAYNDLERGSPVLVNLQQHTEQYVGNHPTLRALRSRVLWGRDEEILAVDNYVTDDVEPAEPGKNHTAICKPRPGYLRPLQFVRYD